MNRECQYAPGVPWERCQSQASGKHGRLMQVLANVGGTVVRFTGNSLCTRAVADF